MRELYPRRPENTGQNAPSARLLFIVAGGSPKCRPTAGNQKQSSVASCIAGVAAPICEYEYLGSHFIRQIRSLRHSLPLKMNKIAMRALSSGRGGILVLSAAVDSLSLK
jgi:hypothetical protein